MKIRCIYNIKGLLHPLTDEVEVPDGYTEQDVENALNKRIEDEAPAMYADGARVRSITLITMVQS